MAKTGATTLRIATEKDHAQWNACAGHPLQSWEWGEFRSAMGVPVLRLIEADRSAAVGCYQITVHGIPMTPWSVAYMPKSGVPSERAITGIRSLAQNRGIISILIEPDAPSGQANHRHASQLIPAAHPLFTKYTFILDLTKPEDVLLSSMHQKTRYNIRVAQKHGVSVAEENTDAAFASYLSLTHETTGRQGFYAHNRRYHETMWRVMRGAGIARLYTARYHGDVLAAWIVFVWKNRIYYPYGASSRAHRDVMAPTLLLWEIARRAKAEGYASFDLWGALPPDPSPSDPWFGFHRFKQGFSPQHVELMGSFDLVIQPAAYRLYTVADRIRWTILSRMRKGS